MAPPAFASSGMISGVGFDKAKKGLSVAQKGRLKDLIASLPEEKKESASSGSSDKNEWGEAIETMEMLIEVGGSKKDIAEWKDAIETLKMLLETV